MQEETRDSQYFGVGVSLVAFLTRLHPFSDKYDFKWSAGASKAMTALLANIENPSFANIHDVLMEVIPAFQNDINVF